MDKCAHVYKYTSYIDEEGHKIVQDEKDKRGKPYKRYIIKSGPLIGSAVSRY